MRMSSRCLFGLIVTACSRGSSQPVAPAVEPAPPDASLTVDAPAPSDASEPASATAPPAKPAPVIARACRGDRLDLDRLVKANTCVVDAERHVPPEIAVTIEPAKLRIKSGAERTASIVLTNTGSTPTSLFLDCHDVIGVTAEMFAADGNRADIESGGCIPGGGGCGGPTYGFALLPGGTLRLDVQVRAWSEKLVGPDCVPKRVRSLPKGTYELRVITSLAPVPVKVVVH